LFLFNQDIKLSLLKRAITGESNMVTGVTGALAPISDLLASVNSFNTTNASSTTKGSSTAAKSSPTDLAGNNSLTLLKDLFGFDPDTSTNSFNNLLYGTSAQSTSTKSKDSQTKLPPTLGGSGFTPVNFNLFNNPLSSLTGLDSVLAADKKSKNQNVKTTSQNVDYGNLSLDTMQSMTLGDLMKLFSFS
jgi:hypothetical protein